LFLSTGPTPAASYNLQCSDSKGSEIVVLTIRDGWSRFTPPTIRVVTDKPGETSPVEVESYTDDQIRVSIDTEVQTFEGQKSAMILTVDRNTGAARFDLQGPKQQDPKTGLTWRLVVATFNGRCERQAPKF